MLNLPKKVTGADGEMFPESDRTLPSAMATCMDECGVEAKRKSHLPPALYGRNGWTG